MNNPAGNPKSCPSPSSSTKAPPSPSSSSLKGNITKASNRIKEIISQNGSTEQVQSKFDQMTGYYNRYMAMHNVQPDEVERTVSECKKVVDEYLQKNTTPGTDVAPSTMLGPGDADKRDQQSTREVKLDPGSTIGDEICPGETPPEAEADIKLTNLKLKQLERRQRVEKIVFDLNQMLKCMKAEDEKELAELKINCFKKNE